MLWNNVFAFILSFSSLGLWRNGGQWYDCGAGGRHTVHNPPCDDPQPESLCIKSSGKNTSVTQLTTVCFVLDVWDVMWHDIPHQKTRVIKHHALIYSFPGRSNSVVWTLQTHLSERSWYINLEQPMSRKVKKCFSYRLISFIYHETWIQ